MSGWLKLSRDINKHWIWDDPIKLKWWIDILITVNFEDKKTSIKFKMFECKKGECLISLKNWGDKWGVSKTVVNNFFNMLENDGMIKTVNETVTTRLIVCNYERYQQNENANETQTKRKKTQQSTTKESKELKEEINIKIRHDEFLKKLSEFKDKYNKDLLNDFYLYWTEKTTDGSKMKFELKETFEIGKRLATWKNKSGSFEKPNQLKPQSVTDKNPYHVIQ